MVMQTQFRNAAVLACALFAGCAVEDGSAPQNLTAPSEFALSVTMSAAPDTIPRDGQSQSVVTVTVRDASGRAVSGQRLTLSTSAGRLSDTSITTNSVGQASFTFTAPSPDTTANAAVIGVTPVSTDGSNAAQRNVTILFTGTPNRTLPTAAFTFSPPAPQANLPVRFDASLTTDEGVPCLDACSYSWNFGDGTTGSGRIATKTYAAGRVYTVTLTVTDPAGSSASTAQSVTVAAVNPPTVTLVVSPNPPLAGLPAVFTATATPAAGHSILQYEWHFGDGTSTTTTVPTVTKTYTNLGAHVARVTATDGMGQTGTAAVTFTIVGSGVVAAFSVSPTNPITNTTVSFNASGSIGAGGANIETWHWDFGNGTQSEEGDAFATTTYANPGTYTVTLTVTDSNGRTGTATRTVSVSEP
jgi:PKD repeat protein